MGQMIAEIDLWDGYAVTVYDDGKIVLPGIRYTAEEAATLIGAVQKALEIARQLPTNDEDNGSLSKRTA